MAIIQRWPAYRGWWWMEFGTYSTGWHNFDGDLPNQVAAIIIAQVPLYIRR